MSGLVESHAELRRSLIALAILSGIFLMFCAATVVYWNFFDTKPPIIYDAGTTYTTNTKGIRTNTFRVGETMLLNRGYCVNEELQALMDRRLVSTTNGRSYGIDTYPLNLPLGCHEGIRPITIPAWVPPDTYRIVVTGTYPNNMLQQGTFSAPEAIIEVTP